MDSGDDSSQEIDRLEQEIKQVQEIQTKIQQEMQQEMQQKIQQKMLQEELETNRRPQLAAVADNKESDSHIDDR